MTIIESSIQNIDLTRIPSATICDECGGQVIEDDHMGQVVCLMCGVVQQPFLLVQQDRRAYSAEEQYHRQRTGGPIALGEATVLGNRKSMKDCKGQRLLNVSKWTNLRRMNSQVQRGPVRGEITGRTEVERICTQLEIPPGTMIAAVALFSHYYHRANLSGHTIVETAAGAVYVTCRRLRVNFILACLAQVADTGETSIYRAVIRICQRLHIRLPANGGQGVVMGHVERIGTELHVSPAVIKAARDVLPKVKFGRACDPCGIAGAILYCACIQVNDRRTEQDIAGRAHVTEVTLRNRMKDVANLFPALSARKLKLKPR